MSGDALILIDIQNDFCPGGALAVPAGDEVVLVANAVMPAFSLVIATQDYHPKDHLSFASNHEGRSPYEGIDLDGLPQVLWPDHCVQGTHGAEFHDDLHEELINRVVQKGLDPRIDSYSGFFDNGRRKQTGLDAMLKSEGVSDVYLMGLATDYCVKWTALDAVRLGYRVHLIVDGCRGINITPSDVENSLRELRDASVEQLTSQALLARRR